MQRPFLRVSAPEAALNYGQLPPIPPTDAISHVQATPNPKDPNSQPRKRIHTPEELLNFAVGLPENRVTRALEKLHANYPGVSDAYLMDLVSKHYIRNSAAVSAGVGGSSAIPGYGLAVGAALSAGELAAFATSTSQYVLTMARLAGVPTGNQELRRALIVSAVLGEDAAKILSDQFGISLWKWAKDQSTAQNNTTLSAVNKALIGYAKKKLAKRMSGHLAGRLIPLGIGAAMGYISGRKIAQQTVQGVRVQLAQFNAGI